MTKVQFDLEGNFEPALSQADKFNAKLSETKKAEDDLRKKFAQGAKEAEQQGGKFLKIHQQQTGLITKLTSNIQSLTKARNESNNPKLIDIYNKKIDEANKKLKSLTTATQDLDDKQDDTNKKTSLFGSILSRLPFANVIQENTELGQGLLETAKKSQGAGKGISILGTAFKGLGIGIVVALIASLIAYFKNTESGGDRLAKTMRVLEAVFGEIVKALADFGEGIANVIVSISDFITSSEDAGSSLDIYSKGVVQLAQDLADLEDQIDTVSNSIKLQNSVLQTQIEKSLKALRNINLTYKDGERIIGDIQKAEEEKLANSLRLNDKEIDAERIKFLLKVKNNEKLQQLNEDDISAQEFAFRKIKDQNKDEEITEEKLTDVIRKENIKRKKSAADYYKDFELFINKKITAEQFDAKLNGLYTAQDLSGATEVLVKREELTRESEVLAERLQNFREQLLERDRANNEKFLSRELSDEKRKTLSLENIEKERLLNGKINQEEYNRNLEKIQLDSIERQKRILAKYGRNGEELDKGLLDARLKIYEAYLKQIETLNEKANASKFEDLKGEDRLKAIKDQNLKEIDLLKKSIEDYNIELGRKKDLTKEQNDQILLLQDKVNKQYLSSLREFLNNEVKELENSANHRLDIQEQIEIEKINLFSKSGMSEKEFERLKQEEILKIQIQYAEKRLSLIQDDGTKETELKILQLKNLIAKSKEQLDGLEKEDNKFSIAKLFGMSDDQFSTSLNNLKTFSSNVISIYSGLLDQEIQINQQRVNLLNQSISERERALDQEIKLNELGFASNVEGQRKQLEEEKKQRDKALKAQAQAQKRKQQIETLEQLGSLATASANILKGYSTLPIAGQVLAIAAIAAMFTAFFAAKAKASQAAKLRKGGQLGGIIDAPSHERGGQTIFTDKGPMEFEGKEFINNQRSTNKHLRLLRALNRDKESEIIEAMLPYIDINQDGIRVNKVRGMRVIAQSSQRKENNYFPGMIQSLKGIESNTRKSKKQVLIIPPGSKIVEISDSGKRIIKERDV